MSSIVIELQRDALDKRVSISELLRKAYVVAKKLRIAEFETWASNELNGYKNTNEIPSYRQIRGVVKAWNPFHGWQPVLFDDHKIANALSIRPCGQAIAEIESLLGSDRGSGSLQIPFPPEAEHQLRELIDFDTQITLVVPSTSLVRIADAARTIILNWAMRLEENGILGEELSFTSTEREAASKTSHNVTNFYGPVQNPQIQQEASHSIQLSLVHQHDIKAISDFLEDLKRKMDTLNLDQEASQELHAEIRTVEAQAESPKPKSAVIKESLSSVRRILEGAGGGVAGQLIMQLTSLLR